MLYSSESEVRIMNVSLTYDSILNKFMALLDESFRNVCICQILFQLKSRVKLLSVSGRSKGRPILNASDIPTTMFLHTNAII